MAADDRKGLPRGEVTFLFTDIERSTTHFHALADAWIHVIERHNDIIDAAVLDEGGVIVKHEGDGVFAAFTDATGAVVAATKAQRAITDEQWPIEGGLRVRMGLHTGRTEPIGRDYISLHVHRAARIAAAGHGGQVLVSESTAAAVDLDVSGATLRDLGRHRLRGFETDSRLFQVCDRTLPDDFPPLRAPRAVLLNIGARPTSFVGRVRERDALAQAVDRYRLVTLTGPGGVGKTRLASEVATERDHPDGVWMVELAALDRPQAVSGAIADTMAVAATPEDDLTTALVRHLTDRDVLLVLDNCEHVVEGVTALTARLLAGTTKVRVLATSRVPLGLDGEHLIRLSSLDELDANQLFTERAASAGVVLDETHSALVANLCRQLDRLPLALELAAARLRSLPIRTLLEHIEEQLDIGMRGDRTRQPRQRSLEALIAWSVDLLEPDTATCLFRLGTFAGHFSLEAADAVCVGANPVSDHLCELVDSSLVEFDPGASRPYHLLETIRRFARPRLTASGQEVAARDAHRAWHVGVVREAVNGLVGPDLRRAEEWVEQIHGVADELAAALSWSLERDEGEMASHLATALALAWNYRDRVLEASHVLSQATALDRQSPAAARTFALASMVAYRRGDLSQAEIDGRTAQRLATEEGEETVLADALGVLGGVAWVRGDPDECERLALGELEIARRLGDPRREAGALNALGLSAEFRGEYERQLELMLQCLEAARRAGDDAGAAMHMKNLAVARVRNGQWEAGRAEFEELLEQQLRLGLRIEAAMTAGTLSFVARMQGDRDRALAYGSEALNIARDVGAARPTGFALNNLGEIHAELGHLTEAHDAYVEALEIGDALGEIERISYCLDGLASLAARTGELAKSVRVLAGAHEIRTSRGFHVPEDYQAINEALIVDLRATLGADEFAKLWSEGRSWSADEVVAAALGR